MFYHDVAVGVIMLGGVRLRVAVKLGHFVLRLGAAGGISSDVPTLDLEELRMRVQGPVG